MKNLLNVGLIVLVLVVLGCNCNKLQELANQSKDAPQSPTVSNTSSSPTTTNSPTSTSKASISMDKYTQLKDNMSKSEVEKILGSAGEEVSSSTGGGFTFSSYKWTGDNFATIIVMYKNDKVMSKTQYGLK